MTDGDDDVLKTGAKLFGFGNVRNTAWVKGLGAFGKDAVAFWVGHPKGSNAGRSFGIGQNFGDLGSPVHMNAML